VARRAGREAENTDADELIRCLKRQLHFFAKRKTCLMGTDDR
jgi:hypothetical protein